MLPPFRRLTDHTTDFEFIADGETLARFEAFLDAHNLEIDAPEAIDWWRDYGPQFDQAHEPDVMERVDRVSRIRVKPSDDAGNSIMD